MAQENAELRDIRKRQEYEREREIRARQAVNTWEKAQIEKEINWAKEAYVKAREILKKHNVDLRSLNNG